MSLIMGVGSGVLALALLLWVDVYCELEHSSRNFLSSLEPGSAHSLFVTLVKVVAIQGRYRRARCMCFPENTWYRSVTVAWRLSSASSLSWSPFCCYLHHVATLEGPILKQKSRSSTQFLSAKTCLPGWALKFLLSQGYDNRVTQRALMMSSMTLAIVSAISALGAFHILPPAYAKTIDEHSGVIKMKSWDTLITESG